MRWPWERHKRVFVVEELDVPEDDPAEARAAVQRAQHALRKAETNGDAMRGIAKAIHRERQVNHFSSAMYRAMRRKET